MDEKNRIDGELARNSEQKNTDAPTKTGGHQARRRKLIVTGGLVAPTVLSLPSSWRRPIVDAVLLPAHAQTTCSAPSRAIKRRSPPCPVVTISAALEGAQASLLTPSGTVVPVLSLTGLQIGGCCNAYGATVAAITATANLTAPTAPVSLPLESGVVSSTGNFGMSFVPPLSPLIPISDIVDITVELDCDGEAQVTLIVPGSLISSVTGGATPLPVVCSF